jgi:hypothetical protein
VAAPSYIPILTVSKDSSGFFHNLANIYSFVFLILAILTVIG